jgi:acyl transferase domain-containing protein
MDKDKDAKAKMSTDQAAFIDDSLMFGFDPDFFNMSTHEADVIDPQQRLLHEV